MARRNQPPPAAAAAADAPVLQEPGPEDWRGALELNLVKPNRFYLDRNLPSDEDLANGRALVAPLVSTFTRTIQGKRYTVSWKVSPHTGYGLPRAFTKKVEGAIMYMAYHQPKPVRNPVYCGSLSEIAAIMGLKPDGGKGYSGRTLGRIRESIQILASTVNQVSMAALYEQEEGRFNQKEVFFHFLSGFYFEGDRYPDGRDVTELAVDLHPVVLSNLNAGYVRPIDWTYARSVSPTTARFYEYFGQWVYGHIRAWLDQGGTGEIRPLDIRYSTLCERLALTRQPYKSVALQKCVAFTELVETRYFKVIDWLTIPRVKDDWTLRFHIGERALLEYERLSTNSRLFTATQLSLFADAAEELAPPVEPEPPPAPVVETIAPLPADTGELVRAFYAICQGAAPGTPKRIARSDRERVDGLLGEGYTAEFIGFLWQFAADQGRGLEKPAAARPGGAIELYLPQAEAAYGRPRSSSRLEAPAAPEAEDPEARYRAAQAATPHAALTTTLLARLREKLSTHDFNEKARHTFVLDRDERSVAIAVKDAFWRDWFESDAAMRTAFGDAVAEALGEMVGVRFVLP